MLFYREVGIKMNLRELEIGQSAIVTKVGGEGAIAHVGTGLTIGAGATVKEGAKVFESVKEGVEVC